MLHGVQQTVPSAHTYIPPFTHKAKFLIIPIGIYTSLSFSQQEQQNSELDQWTHVHFHRVLDHIKALVIFSVTSLQTEDGCSEVQPWCQGQASLHCHCSCQCSQSSLGWISINRNVVLYLPLIGNASSASVCQPKPERNHASEEGWRVKV